MFRWKKMSFGLCGASASFQRYMDHITRGLHRTNDDGSKAPIHVFCYIDDILIASESKEDHIKDLDEVMRRLKEYGMKLSAHKCNFFQSEVDFLGYRLTRHGAEPTKEKVRAIEAFPRPRNLGNLKSFLGMVQFYHLY